MYITAFWNTFIINSAWMSYNLFLAVIPFVLSYILFDKKRTISLPWIVGFFMFILFLPNAPYVFTDLIHLPHALNLFNSKKADLFFIAQFSIFITIGFLLFSESYHKLERFVIRKKFIKNRFIFRIGIFSLMSYGVFLGRFMRFNSWDIVVQPFTLLSRIINASHLRSLPFIILFTAVLFVLYQVFVIFRPNKIQ